MVRKKMDVKKGRKKNVNISNIEDNTPFIVIDFCFYAGFFSAVPAI
jgi:hypothetical protein